MLEVGALCRSCEEGGWGYVASSQDLCEDQVMPPAPQGTAAWDQALPSPSFAGWWVPFVLLRREIKSNPWSAVEHDAEKLTPITSALDHFRAI